MLSDGLHSEQSIVEHRAVTVAFYVRASELPAQRLIAPRYQPVWPVPPAQQQTKATAHTGRQAGRQAGRTQHAVPPHSLHWGVSVDLAVKHKEHPLAV
jgi:hypothetical protein